MDADNILFTILEFAWLGLVAIMGWLFRMMLGLREKAAEDGQRIALLERECELEREHRSRERDETTAWRNEFRESLLAHNENVAVNHDKVLGAINGMETRLGKRIDGTHDRIDKIENRVEKLRDGD